MIYNVYKNISNGDFESVKKILLDLNDLILHRFSDRLIHQIRVDESDYLVLNFKFGEQPKFKGNLAIMYEDLPGNITFCIGILKSLDINGVRFYKKEVIAENINVDSLENRILEMCASAIQKYQSWSVDDLTSQSSYQ